MANVPGRNPTVRKVELPFDPTTTPRHWLGGNALLTHRVNALNLIFPQGEQFFVRAVRRYADTLADDPELAAAVQAFVGQEAWHGRMHQEASRMVEGQGFEIASWLEWYARTAQRLERFSPAPLCLSVTAALEHITACLAEEALTETVLDQAPQVMADLMRWHAAEEIEHRAVAFDVLARNHSSHALRAAGMVLGLSLLFLYWQSATDHLVRQDPDLTPERIRAERKAIRALGLGRRNQLRAALAWFRRDFHPSQLALDGLAERFLTELSQRRALRPVRTREMA